jgi:hypothetical protein
MFTTQTSRVLAQSSRDNWSGRSRCYLRFVKRGLRLQGTADASFTYIAIVLNYMAKGSRRGQSAHWRKISEYCRAYSWLTFLVAVAYGLKRFVGAPWLTSRHPRGCSGPWMSNGRMPRYLNHGSRATALWTVPVMPPLRV